jgi:hypothetical protein
MTHLSLMPNDTWRVAVPALQVPPSSAHLEKPLGQSTAKAGTATLQSKVATARATKVFRFECITSSF